MDRSSNEAKADRSQQDLAKVSPMYQENLPLFHFPVAVLPVIDRDVLILGT